MVRRVFLVVLATAAISLPLSAQQYIGWPDTNPASSASNNTFPMGFSPEWRYQYMLPAACFPSSPFTITDMAFAQHGSFSSSHPGNYTNFEVRMALTTATALTSNFATNLGPTPITVMNRPAFHWAWAPDKWVDFGLDSKFSYDGSSNLVIEIRYTGGSSASLPKRAENPPGGYRAYTRGTGAYTATTATSVLTSSLPKTRFTIETISITASGKPSPGGMVTLHLSSAGDAGLTYQIGSSLGTGPILIDSRKLGLSADAILVVSVGGYLPSVFKDYAGVLDAAGKGTGTINIPNIPVLVGLKIHSAFVTLDTSAPSGIKSISPTETFSITT